MQPIPVGGPVRAICPSDDRRCGRGPGRRCLLEFQLAAPAPTTAPRRRGRSAASPGPAPRRPTFRSRTSPSTRPRRRPRPAARSTGRTTTRPPTPSRSTIRPSRAAATSMAAEEFSATFAKAGSFAYHCNIHSNMKGTVTVSLARRPGADASFRCLVSGTGRPRSTRNRGARPRSRGGCRRVDGDLPRAARAFWDRMTFTGHRPGRARAAHEPPARAVARIRPRDVPLGLGAGRTALRHVRRRRPVRAAVRARRRPRDPRASTRCGRCGRASEIAARLAFVIGPAEELFWRGIVQEALMRRFGRWPGAALAAMAYGGVHAGDRATSRSSGRPAWRARNGARSMRPACRSARSSSATSPGTSGSSSSSRPARPSCNQTWPPRTVLTVMDDRLPAPLAADLDGCLRRPSCATHQDRLYSLALRYVGNAADAEELTQDTFVRAYRALDGLRRASGSSTSTCAPGSPRSC